MKVYELVRTLCLGKISQILKVKFLGTLGSNQLIKTYLILNRCFYSIYTKAHTYERERQFKER